eukprot:14555512-Alexandrium_andersonii.AAC.1
MQSSLLRVEPWPPSAPDHCLQPAGGLFAQGAQGSVFIVDTFQRCGAWLADVVPVAPTRSTCAPARATHVLRRSKKHTCAFADLRDVGLRYAIVGFAGGAVYLATATPAIDELAGAAPVEQHL